MKKDMEVNGVATKIDANGNLCKVVYLAGERDNHRRGENIASLASWFMRNSSTYIPGHGMVDSRAGIVVAGKDAEEAAEVAAKMQKEVDALGGNMPVRAADSAEVYMDADSVMKYCEWPHGEEALWEREVRDSMCGLDKLVGSAEDVEFADKIRAKFCVMVARIDFYWLPLVADGDKLQELYAVYGQLRAIREIRNASVWIESRGDISESRGAGHICAGLLFRDKTARERMLALDSGVGNEMSAEQFILKLDVLTLKVKALKWFDGKPFERFGVWGQWQELMSAHIMRDRGEWAGIVDKLYRLHGCGREQAEALRAAYERHIGSLPGAPWADKLPGSKGLIEWFGPECNHTDFIGCI